MRLDILFSRHMQRGVECERKPFSPSKSHVEEWVSKLLQFYKNIELKYH
jgi:hypothetical protein